MPATEPIEALDPQPDHAPADPPVAVVDKERRRAAELETSIGKLEAQLETLRSL